MLLLLLACLPPVPAPEAAPTLRVLTWNVHITRNDGPAIAEVLRALDPDLALLQEVDPAWAATLEGLEGWPHQAWVKEPDARGLATLSRWPLETRATPRWEGGWFPAWVGTADTPLGPLEVVNLHLLPPVADTPLLPVVTGYLTTKGARRTEVAVLVPAGVDLVAGDFNANARERALRDLDRQGLRSALVALGSPQRTWRWPGLPLRWRIDHVLLRDDRLCAVSAAVHHLGRSDHWPVVVEVAATPHPPRRGSTRSGAGACPPRGP